MNNKLLKQNAIMVLYITKLIHSLDENIKYIEKLSYKNKYSDIKVNKEIKKYFEECLKKAFEEKVQQEKVFRGCWQKFCDFARGQIGVFLYIFYYTYY